MYGVICVKFGMDCFQFSVFLKFTFFCSNGYSFQSFHDWCGPKSIRRNILTKICVWDWWAGSQGRKNPAHSHKHQPAQLSAQSRLACELLHRRGERIVEQTHPVHHLRLKHKIRKWNNKHIHIFTCQAPHRRGNKQKWGYHFRATALQNDNV